MWKLKDSDAILKSDREDDTSQTGNKNSTGLWLSRKKTNKQQQQTNEQTNETRTQQNTILKASKERQNPNRSNSVPRKIEGMSLLNPIFIGGSYFEVNHCFSFVRTFVNTCVGILLEVL